MKWYLPKSPWVSIAENVLEDLLSSFENVKNDMKCPKLEQVKPSLVARVGKVLFQRLDFLLIYLLLFSLLCHSFT